MAEEPAKSEFCDVLKCIDRKFEMIHVKWTEEKFFEVKFRTQIPRDNEDFNELCDEWVDLFSDVTNTVWAKKISNTGPKIRFRKQYQCWTQGGKIIQKELLFDARRCKGTLDMKVLTDNPLTRRKNKHIKLGLNVVVKINFNHLHQVDTTQAYSFFVHTCPPQSEPPRPVIQSNNEKLQQLIADIVQKGKTAQAKANPDITMIKHHCLENRIEQRNTSANCIITNESTELSPNSCSLTITDTSTNNLSNTIANISDDISDRMSNDLSSELIIQETGTTLTSHDLLHKDLLHSSMLQADLHLKPITDDDPITDAQALIQDSLQLSSSLQQPTIHLVQNVSLQNLENVKLELQPQLSDNVKLELQSQLPHYTQVLVSSPQIDLGEQLLMCQPLMFDTTQVIPVSAHALQSHFVQLHPQNIQSQTGQFL